MINLLKMGSIVARLIIAILMILLAIMTIYFLSSSSIDESIKIKLLDIKNNSYPFTIQNIMWIFFYIGIGELLYRLIVSKHIHYEISLKLLPESEESMLTTSDTRNMYPKIKNYTKKESLLPLFIKKLIAHFQSTKSIAQTQELFNSLIDIRYSEMNTDYSMIRYITWIIPTLGFIGTVVGISQALSYAAANDPTSKTFLANLTGKLGVAFDTTLVALLMSAFLVFFLHIIESYEEKTLGKLEEYILDNFITRLYINHK